MSDILPSEHVLENDYPCHFSYWYLVDGKPKQQVQFTRTVEAWKWREEIGAKEIRRCDAVERNLPLAGMF